MDKDELLLTYGEGASVEGYRDNVTRLLDRMVDAGFDRETAAKGLLRALIEPVTEPLAKTGP